MKFYLLFKRTLKSYHNAEGTLRAAALTYQSTLALIPILVLIAIGATSSNSFDQLSKLIIKLDLRFDLNLPIESLPELIEHINQFNFSQLGIVGIIPLLWIFLSSMIQLESAFNAMWGIENKRTWRNRIFVYLPFIFIPSILIAIGIKILKILLDVLFNFFDSGIPFSGQLQFAGFAAIFFSALLMGMLLFFKVIPKIKVHFLSAFWAAFFTSFSCLTAVAILLKFQTFLFDRYSALYGSLAFFPLFLLTSFALWNLVLFGCALSSKLHTHFQNR
jgi:YihY family inner membrane protein